MGRERLVDRIRVACAEVAARARAVRVAEDGIPAYADALAARVDTPAAAPIAQLADASREERAAHVLALDAINFGSGWWPTIHKRPGLSGATSIASALTERFRSHGPWRPEELAAIDAAEVAGALGQDPAHELMPLYAAALRELGSRAGAANGNYLGIVDGAGRSAQALAEQLAAWPTFADTSRHGDIDVPLFKRAQIAASDLALAGVADYPDLDRLTLFADNLVPHVLRLDGVLRFDPELVARIEAGELLEHGSPEEVEIRACAVHAAELIVAARGDTTARDVDHLLWNRGQAPRYKARPRHRSRTTAY